HEDRKLGENRRLHEDVKLGDDWTPAQQYGGPSRTLLSAIQSSDKSFTLENVTGAGSSHSALECASHAASARRVSLTYGVQGAHLLGFAVNVGAGGIVKQFAGGGDYHRLLRQFQRRLTVLRSQRRGVRRAGHSKPDKRSQ